MPLGLKNLLFVSLGLLSAANVAGTQEPEFADRIFHSGDVVTLDIAQPTAQAVAVKGGKIVAVGRSNEVLAAKGPQTEVVDLTGKCLVPGFIDAHGHLTMLAQQMAGVNVASPPVGPVEDLAGLRRVLSNFAKTHSLKPGDWILGSGYDPSLLAEKRHPTRFDLDQVSTEHPIFVLHVSAHLGACNTAALRRLGITADTPNPPGGVIGRVAGGTEPNGVLEEQALVKFVQPNLPHPTLEQSLKLLEAAQDLYARHGHTTVQDGATSAASLKLLLAAAERGLLKVDVLAYPVWYEVERLGDGAAGPGRSVGRLRIGGVKLVLDGSPQGKTAWLARPYFVPPAGQPPEYRGYPAMSDEEARRWVTKFLAKDWQVLAHCNGDAAAEQFIDAIAAAQADLGKPGRRPVMIHAQTVRDDQLDRMQRLGIAPSFFTAHTYYWGDWHRDSVLGRERAERISPARSASERKMRFTLHNDAPVVPPDALRMLWCAVNRRTRSGQVLGAAQAITTFEALKAMTLDAAHQNFEEATKGSIETGKRADLVILSANPLKVAPAALADLKVLETIVEGRSIYRRDERRVGGPF